MTRSPAELGVEEAAAAIRRRELAPAELVEACLERCLANPLNAVVATRAEEALAVAAQLEHALGGRI